MKRLNILFITAWYPSNKNKVAGIFVREHAKTVNLYNNVVVLHCAGERIDIKKNWYMEQENDTALTKSIPVFRVWYRRLLPKFTVILYFWSVLNAFRTIIKKGFYPDVIHAHIYSAGYIAALIGKIYKIPVIITEQFSAFPRKSLSKIELAKARLGFRLAKKVLPVSQALKKSIESYAIHAKFEVVPNVFDSTIFYPGTKNREINDQNKMLFVGLLVPVKGLPYLFKALYQLRIKRDDWHLDIVGDGPQRKEYEEMVEILRLADKITFQGMKAKKEVADMMRQADLFILPSIWDNMPCVLVEAMACGLPIVASNIGGIPEILEGNNGFLTEIMNAEDIAEKLNLALENISKFDRSKIACMAFSQFSSEKVALRLQQIYESIK